MDQIKITDLQIFCHHGVFKEENSLGQKFLVSAVLHTDTREAGLTDDLTKSIHYGQVSHDIKKMMEKHTFQLIERAAEFICDNLLKKYEHLKAIDLEIKKPWAPILLPLECVSVCIHRSWHDAYLGLGSNMGDKKAYLDTALERLSSHDSVKLVKTASYIETEPVGGIEQDNFLNSCVKIETLLTPNELLKLCNEIEKECHRERIQRWGPRTLDIDILFYDQEIIDSENLVIPHKEVQNRLFVLEPLMEIAPYLRHPVYDQTIYQLSEQLKKIQ